MRYFIECLYEQHIHAGQVSSSLPVYRDDPIKPNHRRVWKDEITRYDSEREAKRALKAFQACNYHARIRNEI